ncbi:hypothetical protein Tco_1571547 [Tanacetum coccineum]
MAQQNKPFVLWPKYINREDESDQDCFELPIWHSYSSTNTSASKSDYKRGGQREEEQVFLDDLARLQRQEKEAKEEAEALRKNLEQETENLVTQTGAKLNTAYPLPLDTAYLAFCPIQRIHPNRLIRLRMSKVIKGEFEKIKDVKVEDVSLTCDTPLEIFNMEVSRLSRMDNDLFTYEVEITNIPCNSKIDDDSEHEADDDMRGDDEVELIDEESSDDEDEIAKFFRINTNIFNYDTPLCSAFNEFNYLLKVDLDLLTKDIIGFKTYVDYKDDWIYEWNKDVPWVYDKPWLNNGIWKEPTPVKHTCKPFNYKTGYSE